MMNIYKYQSMSKCIPKPCKILLLKNWQIPDVQPLSSAHTQHPPIGASSSLEPPEKNDNEENVKGNRFEKMVGGGWSTIPTLVTDYFLTAPLLKILKAPPQNQLLTWSPSWELKRSSSQESASFPQTSSSVRLPPLTCVRHGICPKFYTAGFSG